MMSNPMKNQNYFNSDGSIHKKNIINSLFQTAGTTTITDLARDVNLSIPTVTKLVNDMVTDGILCDYGKSDSKSGRKPNTYGLNPSSAFFLGIEIKNAYLNIGLCNLTGELIEQDFKIPFNADQPNDTAIAKLKEIVDSFIDSSSVDPDKIIAACVNIPGRVNSETGYSYSRLNFFETPLTDVLTDTFGITTFIENDTRAMAYGEQIAGVAKNENNILFVNLTWGLGLGIIIDGKVYNGKSGFAGEWGHIHVYDNEIMCHCGKKGCLETEISGAALHRKLMENVQNGKSSVLSEKINNGEEVDLEDIVEAVNADDFLCIELVEELGAQLGQQLAALINIFNPDLVVIGGSLAALRDYIIQPVRQAIKKYALRLVHNDTHLACSKLVRKGGIIGACMTARGRLLSNMPG